MAKSDEVFADLDQIDAYSNTLKGVIDALVADINRTASDGMTGPQVENALTRLTTISTALGALAATPTNPIPPAPAPAPAMPGPFA